jgi:ribonuclease E
MAIEPKTPRKRAAKKVVVGAVTETSDLPVKKAPSKKSASAIPVPIFQAAEITNAKPVRAPRLKAQAPASEPIAKKSTSRKKVPTELAPEPVADIAAGDSDSRGHRRRRGGRGRRRPSEQEGERVESAVGSEEDEAAKAATHRRRRRRSTADGVVPGESVEEDGVVTVVKVREAREPRERPVRSEVRKTPRRTREPRTEYREQFRKRGTIITESEFLARRENVDREMLVRQIGDRTQICVIEDNVMVEQYFLCRQRLPWPSPERTSEHGSCIRRYRQGSQCRAVCGRSKLGCCWHFGFTTAQN